MSPTISFIYNGELISSITCSHRNNARCSLVIKKGRPWTCWSLYDMFSIYCSQCVRKIPAVLKLLCYFQPIMLRFWMIQVTFVNKSIPHCFASLTDYSSYNGWTHTIICCYCNLRITSDQISQCNAESFSWVNRLSHLCFLFLNIWCNPS